MDLGRIDSRPTLTTQTKTGPSGRFWRFRAEDEIRTRDLLLGKEPDAGSVLHAKSSKSTLTPLRGSHLVADPQLESILCRLCTPVKGQSPEWQFYRLPASKEPPKLGCAGKNCSVPCFLIESARAKCEWGGHLSYLYTPDCR
jgi:hypothetical protein